MCYNAVIREFEIIGEIVSKLPDTLKAKSPHIPWQDIKVFCNLLANEYFGVDLQIVWNTIKMIYRISLRQQNNSCNHMKNVIGSQG